MMRYLRGKEMRIITKVVIISIFTVFSLSAYACESCSCDACLMGPEQELQQQAVSPLSNILSLSYCATPYSTVISGTNIQPSTGAGLYIGTLQLTYQHSFDSLLKGIIITPVINRSSSLNNTITDSSSGVGDVVGILRYTVLHGSDYSFTLQGGAKTATGSKKDGAGTTKFSPKLVIGTGSIDALLGLIYTRSFGTWSMSADTLYRMTGVGYDGYQFGNILNLGINGYYTYNDNLRFGLGMVGESAAPNTDTQGVVTGVVGIVPNTGLTLVFLQPVIQYMSGNISADIVYQAPLYRSMVGTQLAVDNRITGSIRMAF